MGVDMAQWSKEDVIKQAFSEIGMGDQFDVPPEDMQLALRKLDAMMASWGGAMGTRVGYSGGNGKGDILSDTTVPDWAYEALYLNLALRLCPDFGKQPNPETVRAAREARDAVRSRNAVPSQRTISGYAGAGNSAWGARQIYQHEDRIAVGMDGTLDILGGGLE